ncbi:MAG: hypothetical protein AB7G35_07675, partial [Hyphomicrobiaceae bacterium]
VTAVEAAAYGNYPIAPCPRRATWMAAVVRGDVSTSPRCGHDVLCGGGTLIPSAVTAAEAAAYGNYPLAQCAR